MKYNHSQAGFVGSMVLRLLLLFLVLAQVVFLATRYRLRVDVTGDRLYTLTTSTKTVLGKLEEQLLVEAYFSSEDKLPPTAKPLRAALRHVLDEYATLGKGRVTVRYLDPESDASLRELALRLGIQPQRAVDTSGSSSSRSEAAIRQVWQGLRLRYGDKKQEIIPLLPFQANTFAYEAMLTPRIRQLTLAELPKIGFLSFPAVPGRPFMGERRGVVRGYGRLLRYFAKQYDFRPLELKQGQLIPQDLEAVILIRPKWLGDREKYAIDQYLVKGGKLVIFADSFEAEVRDDFQNQIRANAVSYDDKKSKLKFLQQLAHYGAKVENRVVSDGVQQGWQFFAYFEQNPRTGQRGWIPITYPYLFEALDVDWPAAAGEFARASPQGPVDEAKKAILEKTLKPGVNHDHDLMKQVLKVGIPGMFWPCPVGLTKPLPNGVEGQVLLWTSPMARDEAAPASEAEVNRFDPFSRYQDAGQRMPSYRSDWLEQRMPSLAAQPPKQIPLMVELHGKFASFFADKEIPEHPKAAAEKAKEEEQKDPLKDWDKDKDKEKEDAAKKQDPVGPKPDGQKAPSKYQDPPMVKKGTKPGTLLVIGDADFIRDDYLQPAYARPDQEAVPPVIGPMSKDWQQPQRAARFFLNLLGWLAEEEDLLELQNKTPTNRAIEFIKQDSAGGETTKQFHRRLERTTAIVQWLNIGVPATILLLVGAFLAIRRRAQRVAFLATLES